MISISNLTQRYAHQVLFEEANLALRPGNRYGIVGKNGAGKSTLLKLIAGEFTPTHGTIDMPGGTDIGLLKQDHYRFEDWRVLDVVIAGKPRLQAALDEKNQLLAKDDFTMEDGIRLGELEGVIAHEEGYEAESFAHQLLSGLGIPAEKHEGTLSNLSGGFKLRVLLAQALFQKPHVLLLDEPTNHLDITSIQWLEKYLIGQFEGILLFVSHDKHFLNSVSNHILDMDFDTITDYTGNFDQHLIAKAQAQSQSEHMREHQEAKIAQLKTFVEKNKAKASKASQAASKQKQIERMELTEVKSSNRRAPFIRFKPKRPSGKSVVKVNDLQKSFGDLQVLKNINFEIFREEKVAIIGPNGMGKSTLLKILMDQLKPDTGTYEWGYETHIGYFAQDHHEQLAGNFTVLEWLTDHAPGDKRESVRQTLGQMLFSGSSVDKKLAQLSGGEAGRLLLAHLILQDPNVLLLDEPTNHLDLEAIASLTEALSQYPGSVLFVSHDRDFVRGVATRIIVLTPEGLKDITASYDEYLDAAGMDFLDRDAKAPIVSAPVSKKDKSNKKRNGRSSSKIEHELAEYENQLLTLDAELANPALYESEDTSIIQTLNDKRHQVQEKIQALMTEWENSHD